MADPSVDITQRISPFLDRHLVFPLLEFLQEKKIYPEDEILKAKIVLLGKTNMVDYAMDIYKSLNKTEQVPEAMSKQRNEVVAKMKELEQQASAIIGFLQDPALVGELRSEKQFNLKMLEEKYQIGPAEIEALYSYAKFQFECGNYSGAADFLYQYRLLTTNGERVFSATWGKLAAEILTQNWESAVEELGRMRDMIDAKTFASQGELLEQRTWLLHWSLFVQLGTENSRSDVIDLFTQDKYLNALQMNAPHLLRYLAVAVVTCKRRRNAVKDIVRVLQQEAHNYRDAATRFLVSLFNDYDFDEAQARLKECEKLFEEDFFLQGKDPVSQEGYSATAGLKEAFLDSARMFIFETYCRLHRRIELKVLASKLDMTPEAAERWISNLIRSAKLDAQIDSDAGTLVMSISTPNVYETLIERSRGLASRTYSLANNVLAVAVNR